MLKLKRQVDETVIVIFLLNILRIFSQIPGGTMEDSRVLRGVMLNKDVTHPKMRRHIEKPRILLLDCNLEYKKGESQVSSFNQVFIIPYRNVLIYFLMQTNIEIMKEEDFTRILELEEEYIQKICDDIIRVKPDVVFTEKGVSDLAQHYLVKVSLQLGQSYNPDFYL